MTIQQTVEAILAILQNPTSNLTAFALIAAAIILVALIAILTAIMWLMAPLSSGADDQEEGLAETAESAATEGQPPTQPESRLSKSLWIGGITLLFVSAFVAAYVGTGSDQFCLDSCHSDLAAPELETTTHDDIRCAECHEDSLPLGLVTNPVKRVLHVIARPGESVSGNRSTIPPSRCDDCHRDTLNQVITIDEIGIIMSHAEPLEAGMACEDCHSIGVHGVPPQPVAMSTCLRCHDAVTASLECSTCHVGDPADAVRDSGRMIVREVNLPPVEDCGGCHEQETCDSCHGIRMPHTRAFIGGEHAPVAAFDRKTLCWRCHEQDDCGACHGDWGSHGSDLKQEHKSWARGSSCIACHRSHEGSFCARCHGPGW